MIFRLSLKDDIWGKYGFPSYSDHGVSLETKLAVLKKMGYVDNEFFKFREWIGTKKPDDLGENYNDLGPASILFTYQPKTITTKPLTIELYTSWDCRFGNCSIGCMVPPVPTIIEGNWLNFPQEKNDRTWNIFYDQVVKVFTTIESRLVATEWFFQGDNFGNFTRPKLSRDSQVLEDRQWTFEEKPVDFKRIFFGYHGSYWGTLWYFKEKEFKLLN